MAQTTATIDEIVDSLTGHDELAIHAAFGKDITDLAQLHKTLFIRAAIAVHRSREAGESMRAAHKFAMDMRMGDVTDYFSADEDAIPAEPDTESGKDA
jgi:hypothetical protein